MRKPGLFFLKFPLLRPHQIDTPMKNISILLAGCIIAAAAWAQQGAPQKNTLPSPSPADTAWTKKVLKTQEEWKKELTPDQFHITREQGTETPYTSKYCNNHEKGMYYCVSCHNPLFSSSTKFDSGTGWPSFWQAYATKSIKMSKDNSLGMERDEISCRRCDAHLGHVFNDGPNPTGLRYCMNGVALLFVKDLKK